MKDNLITEGQPSGESNCSAVSCQCSVCTGCAQPPAATAEEMELPDDFGDGVFCHRCDRFVWNDCGNERLQCPTTGDWLCSVCSNVECPYP